MASWSNGIPICENYCIFKRKSLLKSEKNYASHKKIMTSRYPNDKMEQQNRGHLFLHCNNRTSERHIL